ncbi:MAG TPA: NAD(P)-binding domain-containing protein [Terriglobia bacterium]|nr:NAD(P)-binding domain-containing protein [Terriglobia bacterium]
MALWNVHRAPEQTGKAEPASGKPQPVINAVLCIGCGSCVDSCPETGTLELVNGKAILAHPERCTGHAKCADVCPTSAITLAVGGVRQTIRVPRVDEKFETNVKGVFIVGELGGMGLIKTAINEGRLVIDYIKALMAQQASENAEYDVAIVGAGPAGLSASLTALQHGMKYITLEQGDIASTIRQYPRQKFLMAEPIEMPLYGSLYIADGTKETLLSIWEGIVANTGVQVHTNEKVEDIRKAEDGSFVLSTPRGTYSARHVVLALGKRGTPHRLDVPGGDLAKVTYRLIEAESYQDKDILLIGGGDSAVEAALALSRSGRNRVTLSYRGSEFKRLRKRNLEQLSAAENSSQCRVLRNSSLNEIRPDSVSLNVDGSVVDLKNDYVLGLIGGESPESFLRKVGIDVVEKTV